MFYLEQNRINEIDSHCVKSVQIRSFFLIGFVFGLNTDWILYSVQRQENKDQKDLRIWTIFTPNFLYSQISLSKHDLYLKAGNEL